MAASIPSCRSRGASAAAIACASWAIPCVGISIRWSTRSTRTRSRKSDTGCARSWLIAPIVERLDGAEAARLERHRAPIDVDLAEPLTGNVAQVVGDHAGNTEKGRRTEPVDDRPH